MTYNDEQELQTKTSMDRLIVTRHQISHTVLDVPDKTPIL